MKRFVDYGSILEAGLVLLFWVAGWALVRAIHLPFPAGLAGFVLLLLVLVLGWLPLQRVRHGADWLLARMLVFFVPAVLAVMDYGEFAGVLGLKILFVIIGSTVAVMLATGAVVHFAQRGKQAR
jgi:holin-like protein